ncbi:Vacuolar protein sorting-associated protein 13C [Operophtera brumata]|uniref:Vacuolar protein sorting-associated protein 13C n=1 Tax=Operophtera brumata TaxID=104452 RepID=A0A0L7KXU7_OPEBR|nr:Vacuolar protein sorting-associated protein 13C [Operophtera brumata]
MVVCDGYTRIVEVTGPYDVRTSDAKILRQILHNHTDDMEDAPIRWFLETDDVMVLDRGFRDALSYAEECGFTTKKLKKAKRAILKLTQTDKTNTLVYDSGEHIEH